jgi:hypothetical protein
VLGSVIPEDSLVNEVLGKCAFLSAQTEYPLIVGFSSWFCFFAFFLVCLQLHQSCLGRCSRRSIQLVPRQVTKSAGVCLPRSGHLNVSRLNKNVRSCYWLTNAFVGGSSGSLASFVTQGPRGRDRCSFICAGVFSSHAFLDLGRV